MDKKEVQFLRTRDYVLLQQLGRGACGSTVVLRDEFLQQDFVCKKYSPLEGLDKAVLFQIFCEKLNCYTSVIIRMWCEFLIITLTLKNLWATS
jgi:hypothetical protein